MVEPGNSPSYLNMLERYIYSKDCIIGNTTLGANVVPEGLDYIFASKCRETHMAIGMRSSLMLLLTAITAIAWVVLFGHCVFYRYKKNSLQAIVDRKMLTTEEVRKALYTEWSANSTKLLEEVKTEQQRFKDLIDQDIELKRLRKVELDYKELKEKVEETNKNHLALSQTFQSAANFNKVLIHDKAELENKLSVATVQIGELALSQLASGTLVPNPGMASSRTYTEGSFDPPSQKGDIESGGESDAEDYLVQERNLFDEHKKCPAVTTLTARPTKTN